MKTIDYINKCISTYEISSKQSNGTWLLGMNDSPPPLATHYVYASAEDAMIESIISQYKYDFPKSLIEVYKIYNGFDMFWNKVDYNGYAIPMCHLSCYGLNDCEVRDVNNLTPIDIRVEDLSKPLQIPHHWLKFGRYTNIINERYDLYIDTTDEKVYLCAYQENVIINCWSNLDDALYSLLIKLASTF